MTEHAPHTAHRQRVDDLARALIAEWERVEGPVNVSYVANFADLARVALAHQDNAARSLVSDWQANGNSRGLGDPTAEVWQACALQLLEAIDAPATSSKADATPGGPRLDEIDPPLIEALRPLVARYGDMGVKRTIDLLREDASHG